MRYKAPRDPDSDQDALDCAVRLLSASSMTERRLNFKLRQRGFTDRAASAATAEAISRKYIDDRSTIGFAAADLSNEKLYGRRRVAAELVRRGYRSELIEAELAEAHIDWTGNCARFISAHGGTDEEDHISKRLLSQLLRAGYDYGDIRSALGKGV